MLQIIDTVLYLVSALVIYRYAGPSVESPAINSLGTITSKVAWGLAIPTVTLTLALGTEIHLMLIKNRQYFQGSSWGMLHANTSMCACFVGLTKCTSEVFCQLGPGSPFVLVSGWYLGSWQNRFLCSMICSVSLYVWNLLENKFACQANADNLYRVHCLEVGSAVRSTTPKFNNWYWLWPNSRVSCSLLVSHELWPILPNYSKGTFDSRQPSCLSYLLCNCEYTHAWLHSHTAFWPVAYLLLVQCGLGLYVSGVAIHEDSSSSSWTCANNAWSQVRRSHTLHITSIWMSALVVLFLKPLVYKKTAIYCLLVIRMHTVKMGACYDVPGDN